MKKNLSDYLVAFAVIACSLVLLGALTYALSGGFVSKSDRFLEIDYPDVSGIKLPFVIRTSDVSSYDTVVRKFSEIKTDSSVTENVFDTPRGPSSP